MSDPRTMVRYVVPTGQCLASFKLAVVPMGSLDDDPGIRPQAHIFVSSSTPWETIADGLPQFAEYPTV